MNKYYQVVATLDGEKEVLFGSFEKADCVYEIDAEKASWKDDGYKGIKIEIKETNDKPDLEVYKDSIVTSEQFFQQQAPSFNFELNEDELIEKGLEVGFITKIEGAEDLYLINRDY